MRLIGNKEDISYDKVTDRLYWKEYNIWNSNKYIWDKQYMDIYGLINSNFLIHNIYYEINKERYKLW